jgi:hypothetical protein
LENIIKKYVVDGSNQGGQIDIIMSNSDDAGDSFSYEDNEYDASSSSPHKRFKLGTFTAEPEFKVPIAVDFDIFVELQRLAMNTQLSLQEKSIRLLKLCTRLADPLVYDVIKS